MNEEMKKEAVEVLEQMELAKTITSLLNPPLIGKKKTLILSALSLYIACVIKSMTRNKENFTGCLNTFSLELQEYGNLIDEDFFDE
jgi:transcription initiation factor TFIIIB Brf1 subunit/transcription initiation factor TFIIB